jgi:hypothetical protein
MLVGNSDNTCMQLKQNWKLCYFCQTEENTLYLGLQNVSLLPSHMNHWMKVRNDETNIPSCHYNCGSAEGTTSVKQTCLMWSVTALCLAYIDNTDILLGMCEEATTPVV